jgi:ribosomal protein S18 acetylase RimI-like enzyme
MSEIDVRRLTQDEWTQFRAVRLEALLESPEAFSATYAQEAAFDEATWRSRLERSPRFVADRDAVVLGTASLGTYDGPEGEDTLGEVFGLWVTPAARGTGVATALAKAAAKLAREQGRSHVVYWVSTSNGRAVAFASGLGFRPTDSRRPMRGSRRVDVEEIAMILALGSDHGTLPDLG